MKGYKIGIDKESLEFVLIELEVPEEYPGAVIYNYEVEVYDGLFRGRSLWDTIVLFPEENMKRTVKQYRTNIARILSIQKIRYDTGREIDSAISLYDENFYYYPGEIIYPDSFDLNSDLICTNGIHFFGNVINALKFTDDGWTRYRRDLFIYSRAVGRKT